MSYYLPPSPNPQGGFYPPPNPGFQPGRFPPDDHYTPSGEFQPPGPYIPMGQYPQPGQYPPPGQYPMPGQYPPPGQYVPTGQYPPPGQYMPPGEYQPTGQSGQSAPYGQPYGGPGYGGPSAVVSQPMPQNMGDWSNTRPGFPNCPPGLEYLIPVSSLFVKQKVELLEAFTGFETKNKFTIKNKQGDKLYYAVEESDCCTRNLCGPLRPFNMKIMDAQKNEIIHVNRPLACDSCWFPCCLQRIEVSSPPGNVIGTIEQEWSIFQPKFLVKDAVGETVLKLEGPFCTFSICGAVEFKVLSRDGQYEVGKISKEWSGFLRELFTDADYFGVSFPEDLDVRMKAVMIGAVFLIDAMFFEKRGNKESDGPGML